MSRVLLADDSAHAQRMGEFILREEGFEIVSVTDGATALVRLADVDPDLVLADISLPGHNGYELCRFIKNLPRHRHVKVVLTAGAQEPIDDEEAGRAGADGRLHKPFEASAVVELARRLVEEARQARLAASGQDSHHEATHADAAPEPEPEGEGAGAAAACREAGSEAASLVLAGPAAARDAEPSGAVSEPIVNQEERLDTRGDAAAFPRPDPEAVRAAVTLALESSLPVLIDEITQRVTVALEDAAAQPQRAGKAVESEDATGI